MLNVSKIAEMLNIKPSEVNNILTEIGYQKKIGNGYRLQKERLGKQKLFKGNPGETKAYIIWNDIILNNAVFLKAVGEFKVPYEVPVIPKEETYPSKSKKKKDFKFDRETFKAEFRTMDGHYVRSKAEVIIDNWLYMNGFVHAYERRVPIVEELYCDFYLKEQIYIEFWGLEDTKYLDRKKKKLALYEQNGLKLVGLTEEDVKNIDDTLPIKLLKHGVSVV